MLLLLWRGGGGPRPVFAWLADRLDRGGLSFFHSVIWDKKNPGLGQRYRRQHEMLMVAHRQGGRIRWADGQAPVPNVISMMPPRERVHQNEKPLDLLALILGRHTNEGDAVLDPFMGSGTTLVACQKLGRNGTGIEIDPEHFDIACRRVDEAARQPRLDLAPPPRPDQGALL